MDESEAVSPVLGAERRIWLIFALLWLFGALRLAAVWAHHPLIAYANSYDETRYTSCFHLYPDRPPEIPPQQNSPAAPFEYYRFIATNDPMCYWSSELVFQGATVAIYKVAAWLGASAVHSVRWIGLLRITALLGLSVVFSLAWLRRGRARNAIANAALLPLVFADPGNTLYLNTFYAEWTALLAAYALISLIALWRGAHATPMRFTLLALAGFALASSKIQHLLLPLALSIVVLIVEWVEWRRVTWRGMALLIGGLAGLCFQFVQMQRDNAMMLAIRQYNAADVVFTGIVPFAQRPRALLADLDIDPSCARFRGNDAWQMPGLPDRLCAGLANFSRGKELILLLSHPAIALRLAWHGVYALDPWVASNVGHVAGEDFAQLPADMPSVGNALHASRFLQWMLLALPFAALAMSILRRRQRTLLSEYAMLISTLMVVTFVVTVLGDGLADTAKQGHLVTNAALAFLLVLAVIAVLPRSLDADAHSRNGVDSGLPLTRDQSRSDAPFARISLRQRSQRGQTKLPAPCTPSTSTSNSARQMSPASNNTPASRGAIARSAAITSGACRGWRT
ncbi:MAG: hypothetical protein WBW61_05465 [Rhodanobacteraceae bacterium]